MATTPLSPPAIAINHTSPEDSPNHQAVRAAVRKGGQDEEVLRTILWLINGSDELRGIRKISANLLGFLSILHKTSARSPEFASEMLPFRNWDPVLEWISSELPRDICPVINPASHNPNEGDSYKRNPLWADLWENAPQLQVLQTQILFAQVHYLYYGSHDDARLSRSGYERYCEDEIWPALLGSTYNACLTLRKLLDSKWQPVLANLPTQLPPRKFLDAFSALEVPKGFEQLTQTWREHRDTIKSFLAQANGFEPWSHRSAVNGPLTLIAKPSRFEIDPASPGDPDDPDTRCWPEGQIGILTAALPDEIRQAAIDCDFDEAELADQQEYYLVSSKRKSTLQQLAVRGAIAARGQYRHVRMQHQLLPFDYAIPATFEVHSLVTRLQEAWHSLGQPSQWTDQNRIEAETIALIGIELWLGVSLTRAHGLVVVRHPDPRLDATIGFGCDEGTLLYDRGNREWLVPVDPPRYRRVIGDPDGQARRHLRWLPLPDTAWVGQIIDTITEHNKQSAGCNLAPIFAASPEVYEEMIREFLRADPRTRHITLRRLGLFIFNQLTTLSGDLMTAALITGRFPTQTRSERFYSSYPVDTLRQLHWRAVQQLLPQLTGVIATNWKLTDDPVTWAGHVGARLCAKDDAIAEAIKALKRDIRAVRKVKRKRDRAHNLLTLYTVLLFGFSTSCRPTRIPYLPCNRVDKGTRFAALSDKDDDAHHKLRLIYIPKLCWDQMLAYEAHCRKLASEHPAVRDFAEPCFFVDKMQPLTVRHDSIAKYLKNYIKLPLNFYRVYMRHKLLEAGTPPEVVMAWLGHAFAGEELWGPYSTLGPSQYRACIDHYLSGILKELGWEVLY